MCDDNKELSEMKKAIIRLEVQLCKVCRINRTYLGELESLKAELISEKRDNRRLREEIEDLEGQKIIRLQKRFRTQSL